MLSIKQAIKYFWIKTLKSQSRVLALLIELNYLFMFVLILTGRFVLTAIFLAFYYGTLIALCVVIGIIKFNKVNTNLEIDLGK